MHLLMNWGIIMNNQDQPLIFEISTPGRIGYSLPEMDVTELALDEFIPD